MSTLTENTRENSVATPYQSITNQKIKFTTNQMIPPQPIQKLKFHFLIQRKLKVELLDPHKHTNWLKGML